MEDPCPTNTTGAITVNGTNTSHLIAGRMLICDGMEWRAVCSGGWDREDATVVCRQLGFPAAGKPSSNVEV